MHRHSQLLAQQTNEGKLIMLKLQHYESLSKGSHFLQGEMDLS